MEKFIGTKIIKAFPEQITWKDHYNRQGWEWPEDKKDGDRIGYTVGYPDAKGNFDGKENGGCHYITWSPADVFEASYTQVGGMTFGQAIEALKLGKKVARKGWNGKDMYLALVEGSTIEPERARTGVCKGLADEGFNNIDICPHIDMRAADGSCVVGWLASQTDMLSDDWEII